MNDAPVDIGLADNLGNAVTPIVGEALPLLGLVAFLDHNWSDAFDQLGRLFEHRHRQLDAPGADAFRTASTRWQPALLPGPNVMFGGEFQWGKRDNFADGFTSATS